MHKALLALVAIETGEVDPVYRPVIIDPLTPYDRGGIYLKKIALKACVY